MHKSNAAEPIRRTSRTTGSIRANSAAWVVRRRLEYAKPVPTNAIDKSSTVVHRNACVPCSSVTCAPRPLAAEYTRPATTSATAPATDTPSICAATDTA